MKKKVYILYGFKAGVGKKRTEFAYSRKTIAEDEKERFERLGGDKLNVTRLQKVKVMKI